VPERQRDHIRYCVLHSTGRYAKMLTLRALTEYCEKTPYDPTVDPTTCGEDPLPLEEP